MSTLTAPNRAGRWRLLAGADAAPRQHRARRLFRRPPRLRNRPVLHATNDVGIILDLLAADDGEDDLR
jgi:hypothetical protein